MLGEIAIYFFHPRHTMVMLNFKLQKIIELFQKVHQDITEMQYERVPESFDLEQNEDSREPGFLVSIYFCC